MQFLFDIRDICVLKFGYIYTEMPMIENPFSVY